MRIANLVGHATINGAENAQRADGTPRKVAMASVEAVGEKTRDRLVLDAARAVLDDTPEIDVARVARVRAALAAGDIRVDAVKLADVIQRYHGGCE
ncbi:flagellar biosynthesis anti-sigma factor FlgM [Burkholderia dolosa]|nr:flagellar biosynthesis anti-sigma factor FlgM [Burkholderia dolosa]